MVLIMNRKPSYNYEYIKNYIESNSNSKLLTTELEFNLCIRDGISPSKIKLTILCGICNKETFTSTFSRLLERNKLKCYHCAIKDRSLPYVKVKKYIEVDSNSGCTLLSSTYSSVSDKLSIKCKCGNVFEVTFNKFKGLKQMHCKECGEKIRKFKLSAPYNTILKYCIKNNLELITTEQQYKIDTNNLLIKFSCGHIEKCDFVTLKHRKTSLCFNCTPRENWDINKIKEWLNNNEPSIELLSNNYINTSTPLKFKCDKNHIFEKDWKHFKDRGQRCPICTPQSIGEMRIEKLLQKLNIRYDRQYRFDDCKDKRPLPFDFVVYKDNKISFLIEYNGRQHYTLSFFGSETIKEAEEEFERIKRTDKLKFDYCDKNNLELMVIPYTELNKLESLIINKLIESNLIIGGEQCGINM
jgi:hypothetical protein